MTDDAGHSDPEGNGLWSLCLQNRFAVLLCALTLLLVGTPLVRVFGAGSHMKLANFVIPLLFSVVLLSAVFAVSRSRTTEILALLLAIPAVVLQGLQSWRAADGLAIAAHTVGILFLSYAVILVLKYLFAARRVSSDMICASLCVYLLLGISWALAYSLLHYLDPNSFAFSFVEEDEVQVVRFGGERTFVAIYYSFVTMSTLGYGDIVPASPLARMCAALQAIVGQLYLAVLVARLVGLHISHSQAASAEALNTDANHGSQR